MFSSLNRRWKGRELGEFSSLFHYSRRTGKMEFGALHLGANV